MIRNLMVACLLVGSALGADVVVEGKSIRKVAFGSCYRPGRQFEVWDSILAMEPDLFLFLGDNVYADTEDMGKMRVEYDKLLADEGFGRLREKVEVRAVWDDHDFGENDAGAEFAAKKGAKREFMRAFSVAEDHPMRKRGGIYHSVMYVGKDGKRVQLVMLDTRFFRSALKSRGEGRRKIYLPNKGEGATVLGPEQWAWLENELAEPADFRIIGSSIQVVSEEHRYEKWANFPDERERLLEMVKKAGVKKTLLVSGDRHMGEISRDGGVMEVTSSGLTNAGGGYGDKNRHRVGKRVGRRNFGFIEISWVEGKARVGVKLLGVDGALYEEGSL